MSELDNTPRTYSGALLAAIAVALLGALGGLIWSATLSSRLSTQQVELTDAKQQNVTLAAELRETNARLQVATDELGKSLGTGRKSRWMPVRRRIIRREAAQEANSKRLESAQQQTAQQVNAVSSEVSNVKDRRRRREVRCSQDPKRSGQRHQQIDLNAGRSERPQQPHRPQSR